MRLLAAATVLLLLSEHPGPASSKVAAQEPERGSPSGSARIVGRVIDPSAGEPVVGATVALAGTTRRGSTDAAGRFTIPDLVAGRYELRVQHLAYRTVRREVDVPGGSSVYVEVRLAADPVEMDPLLVTAVRDRRLEVRGFYERKAWGEKTGRGHFFTREDVRRRNPQRISHLVGTVPGMWLDCDGRACVMKGPARFRSLTTCEAAAVYVDGIRVVEPEEGGSVSHLFNLAEVVAVEVYPRATDVPGEFAGSTAQCGVVAIWTG